MPIPDVGGWELPAIALFSIIVIGWLLWTQREERRRVATEMRDERRLFTDFIQEMLTQAEADRREFMASYRDVAAKSIEGYYAVCKAIEDHDQRASEIAREHARQSQEMWQTSQREHEKIISALQLPMRQG